jgi:hypothetical protein
MECREFNEVLIDLACEYRLDAAARQRAFLHAIQCASCAQQLAVQEELKARLREFSTATADLRSPASVSERLRAAVAELRLAQSPVPAAVIPIDFLKKSKKNVMSWALAAAAILILLLGAGVWRYFSRAPVQKETVENSPMPMKNLDQKVEPAPEAAGRDERDDSNSRAYKSLRKRQSGQRATVGRSGSVADQAEAASGFVPLTPVMDQKAIENGMIVRLEVSRSKLIAMGLPLHMEGDGGTINAEVVMGDNGVAYAIRVFQ